MASKKGKKSKSVKTDIVHVPTPPNRIQIWDVAVKREHYDNLPLDWPRQFITCVPELVLRPLPKEQAMLKRPVNVQVLGPASAAIELQNRLGDKFSVTVVSDGLT